MIIISLLSISHVKTATHPITYIKKKLSPLNITSWIHIDTQIYKFIYCVFINCVIPASQKITQLPNWLLILPMAMNVICVIVNIRVHKGQFDNTNTFDGCSAIKYHNCDTAIVAIKFEKAITAITIMRRFVSHCRFYRRVSKRSSR